MAINISYQDTTLATFTSGSRVLKTAGKYLADDITIESLLADGAYMRISVIPEQTVTTVNDTNGDYLNRNVAFYLTKNEDLIVGAHYIITLDGVEYVSECQEMTNWGEQNHEKVLGTPQLVLDYRTTDYIYPFAIDDNVEDTELATPTLGQYVVQVDRLVFLGSGESTPTPQPTPVVTWETTYNGPGWINAAAGTDETNYILITSYTDEIEIGDVYRVTYNNNDTYTYTAEYSTDLAAFNNGNGVYFGNGGVADPTKEDNTIPFFFYKRSSSQLICATNLTSGTTVTLLIEKQSISTDSVTITENGTYDVSSYSSAIVSVPTGSGESSSVTISEENNATGVTCIIIATNSSQSEETWELVYDGYAQINADTPYGTWWNDGLADVTIPIGSVWRITIDNGQSYELTAVPGGQYGAILGNPKYSGLTDDGSDVPFCFHNAGWGAWSGGAENTYAVGEHTIRVERFITS